MSSTSVSPTTPLRAGALTVGGTVLATALLWTIAQVLGVELRVDPRNGQAPSAISLPFTVTVTLVVSLLGWGARALLDRLTRRAATIWTGLAVLVLLASFLPLLAVEATGPAKAILALMHVAVAAALIPFFGRRKS
ncbi:DUF6069 family protein [Micromonospora costi]|uniref:Uncharacterized protein n=1 Tax=Micromonospora costi TaxID=1530042 RepID=A0A3A9ZY30_9ACTN|nr:DUF6069 family protein [Micromonospora costi]RKN53070.1 hypothetical protein D7193_25125 [Micromonospora costi]